ncbi:alpha/beta hydrolase [Hydrogenophaga sp.]|uniref:alpha/beta hydrolase n=1 Tax=Hydrogenophaga sp. TaxID=1904254 RepID=UPI0027219777|nr:alpha/beta hydrolase [Hydrogenophaga sp.]MDO8904468.1 alpha/beta hydrolase [Hydrogenophaga sp.]
MIVRQPALLHQWVHIQYQENSAFTETYGFSGSQGAVNLEGLLISTPAASRDVVFLMMHPSSTLQLLPLPPALAAAGYPVLCMGTRYAKNDTALIMEKVVLDVGASVRHAREVLGFARVVLMGWSGGGSLALFYQSQAERPSIQRTPAGEVLDLNAARLPPADAVVLEAAHRSRAHCLRDWIDPSVLDEDNPDLRNPEFDLYAPGLPVRPPYPADWLAAYRAAQLARVRRITARVQDTLDTLRRRGGPEVERGFVTHRTLADPRFLDGDIDPNGRVIGRCYLGVPETVNSGPVGMARFSTLRSWLSQWSIDDSRAMGEACARDISVPLLAIEHGADDAVPQPDIGLMFDACASTDKVMQVVVGANHYFQGQPGELQQSVSLITAWMRQRGF